VKEAVAEGATLITDEHAAYVGMDRYVHYSVNHSAKQYVDGMAHTNGIESVWTLLKRGYYGVYHSFTKKHLQRYLNEFMYRLNAGRCEVRTLSRIDSLVQMSACGHLSYAALIAR